MGHKYQSQSDKYVFNVFLSMQSDFKPMLILLEILGSTNSFNLTELPYSVFTMEQEFHIRNMICYTRCDGHASIMVDIGYNVSTFWSSLKTNHIRYIGCYIPKYTLTKWTLVSVSLLRVQIHRNLQGSITSYMVKKTWLWFYMNLYSLSGHTSCRLI